MRITIRIEPGKGNPMYPAPTEPPKMKEEIKYLKDFLQNVFPEMDMMVPINKVLQGPKGPMTLKKAFVNFSAVTVV